MDWIQSKIIFPIGKKTLDSWIKRLLAVGLLQVTPSGKLIAPNINYNPGNKDPKLRAKFHKCVIAHTIKNMTLAPGDDQPLNVSYFNIKKQNLALAKMLIQKFQKDFGQLISEDHGENVYQLSIQFVPMTHSLKINRKELKQINCDFKL